MCLSSCMWGSISGVWFFLFSFFQLQLEGICKKKTDLWSRQAIGRHPGDSLYMVGLGFFRCGATSRVPKGDGRGERSAG